MIAPSGPLVPLSIVVVFHETCDESKRLAVELFRWFRMQHDDGDALEAGVPVWYRCRVANKHLEPPLHDGDAALNVVIVLVGDKMATDPAWRAALENDLVLPEVAPTTRLVLPVAVDDSFYRLPFLYRKTQPIRIGPSKNADPGPRTPDGEARRFAGRAALLRRSVTEVVARCLRPSNPLPAPDEMDPTDPAPGALRVFISHAKRDGRRIAEQVRDRLAVYGQLKAWYDANELPPGFRWKHPMEWAAKANTAALVSVVSDAYATRYWCRREVELARTPRPYDSEGRVWTVQPTVAVQVDGGMFQRPMAPLSQVVHLGWSTSGDRDDVVEQVVDRLVLEILLAEFYRQLCVNVAALVDHGTLFVTFVPDPWTLTRLTGELRAAKRGLPERIAYPGFGLRSGELIELRRAAADLGYPQVDHLFVTLEELSSPVAPTLAPAAASPPAERPSVVMSAGGTLAGMAAWASGEEHANDLLVRLSLRLLRRGWRLVYGGSLAQYDHNVTRSLLEVARVYGEEQALGAEKGEARATADELRFPPLVNYAAWPNHRFITEHHKASQVGICDFVEVRPPGALPSVLKEQLDRPRDPLTAYLGAEALTAMRKGSATGPLLRVAVGGKTRGWQGWLPGIAEEVAMSLAAEREQPFVIIGSLGGCAGELAVFLAEDGVAWPPELTFERAMDQDEPFRRLIDHPGARAEAHARFADLQARLTSLRDRLHRLAADAPLFPGAPGGPTRAEFLDLLRSRSATGCINTIVTIADRLRAGRAK